MRNKQNGFTLIELLVVVAIIAMLVSILSVAQRKVRIISKNLKQKAAFHAGEISLELYSKDFGGYPDSSLVADSGTFVTGAQRLAEAFFGRDDRGFHPKTKWHPDKDAAAGQDIYTDLTLKDRKTPYFERKRVGFHTVYDLWGGATGAMPIYDAGVSSASVGPDKTALSPVFTDVFTRNKVVINGESEKVGMPILYFRADPTKRFRVDSTNTLVDPAVQSEYKKWVYDFDDNLPILQLPWLRDPTAEPDGMTLHYKDPQDAAKTNAQVFYEKLTQRQDGNFYKPYNKTTFIFISAGYDGIYGTKDDLTNFDN